MGRSTVPDTSESSSVAGHVPLSRPPSAIATFSNLIFPVKYRHISSETSPVTTPTIYTTWKSKSPTTRLEAFPTEILMLIFQLAFEACIDWHKTSTFHWTHAVVWLEDDPLSPSLFPYSLASVCVRWLHILSSVAVYWTRQVVIVGSHATSQTAIQTLLQWVGNVPLQLIVTRHAGISGGLDGGEHARIRALLDLLQLRTHHIWSLTFKERHTSSLPIWRGHAHAPHLGLPGTSSIADHPPLPELHLTRDRSGCNTSLAARSPKEIILGGRFVNDVLMFGEQCNNWFCNITSLTIRGDGTSHGGGVSLYRLMSMIQACGSLERLMVEDVAFVDDVHPSHRFRLEAPIICLYKLADAGAFARLVSQCLGIRSKEVITVAHCPFDGFAARSSSLTRVSSTKLVLESVAANAAGIETLVCFWNGENLSVTDCPGVTDTFLRRFPTEETPPDLRRLQIVDCENVSTGGLMAVVKSREIQSVIDSLVSDDRDEPCAPLVELHVHGRGPPITVEQAVWFTDHLETFSWDTIAKDGTRYSWDASARELTVLPPDR